MPPIFLLAIAAVLVVAVLAFVLRSRSPKEQATAAAKPPRVSVDAGHPENAARVTILYGTQTGTAERFSKQLGNELRAKYSSLLVDVRDVENYTAKVKLPKEKLVVFAVATYGDGEPTDNAAEFYSWVCKEADAVEAGDTQPYLQVRGVASSYVNQARVKAAHTWLPKGCQSIPALP